MTDERKPDGEETPTEASGAGTEGTGNANANDNDEGWVFNLSQRLVLTREQLRDALAGEVSKGIDPLTGEGAGFDSWALWSVLLEAAGAKVLDPFVRREEAGPAEADDAGLRLAGDGEDQPGDDAP